MRIAGFQALSLLDYPERPCAIVFTQGCPLRCGYCHNPSLIPHEAAGGLLAVDDVLARLDAHAATVDAVCVTGGEPTVQPGLLPFLRVLKERGFAVKLDTNGVHPDLLADVLEQGLADYVAMDLKHDWDGYEGVAGALPAAIRNIRRSFGLLREAAVPHEFRTTVVPAYHTEEDLERMADLLPDGTFWAWQPVRYGNTLDPDLPRLPPMPLEDVRARILARRPSLRILIRP